MRRTAVVAVGLGIAAAALGIAGLRLAAFDDRSPSPFATPSVCPTQEGAFLLCGYRFGTESAER